jgi:hypothetical protein
MSTTPGSAACHLYTRKDPAVILLYTDSCCCIGTKKKYCEGYMNINLIYRIPLKAIKVYLIIIFFWSILGFSVFPQKTSHFIIIVGSLIMLYRLKGYKNLENQDQFKVLLGCCIFGLIGIIIMATK